MTTLLKTDSNSQVFSCQIYEIFQTIFLEEHLRTTASKHRSSFLEVFCRSCCLALINAVMKYSFRSSGSKLECVTWKFTKSYTPSQVFFKQFHHSCRTTILKNVSWWLLLRMNLFCQHSCMAASQKQLQTYICFRNSYTYFTFLSWRHVKEERNFMIYF